MKPEDGSLVPGDHDVLRLPVPPKDFVAAGWRPTHVELEPSREDKQRTPVRVSVWDTALTAVDEARSARDRSTLVLEAGVAELLERGVAAVVYDNLEEPDARRPGADGHAGLEGLERRHGEPRPAWRDRLQHVADGFKLLAAV